MKIYPLLLACALTAAGTIAVPRLVHAQAAPGAAAVAPVPFSGTTLRDTLKLQSAGDIRTTPSVPQVGVFGVIVGQPAANAQGHGIQIDNNGQAILYPGTELLGAKAGTIEFSVLASPKIDPAMQRVLLDSFSGDNGPSRIMIALTGNQLTLNYTGQDGVARNVVAPVDWSAAVPHTLAVTYDTDAVTLYVDGNKVGALPKPSLAPREPLGIVLGNSRDYNLPSHTSISDLRLANANLPLATAATNPPHEDLSDDDLLLRMAQGYQRRLYPLFEKLRGQGVKEVDLSYAFSYADIGDFDRALQTAQPYVNDVNNPLNVVATFLRVDVLTEQNNFNDAFDQLQTLAANKDVGIAVRAQVRQAKVLFAQGNQTESLRLLGDIIAKYPDLPGINEAYLMIGLDRFKNGDFQKAYDALRLMATTNGKSRLTTPIGLPLVIKVADPDLSVRLNDAPLIVSVTTKNGDKEEALLRPAFSKGVYTGTLDTELGEPKPGDKKLQLIGGDKITVTYEDKLSSGATDQARVISIGIATDGQITALAQSALDVYREVQEYKKADLLDDSWVVVANLPKTASAFFRDPETGNLRRKGFRFDPDYISSVKAGQSVYIELNDPDGDITPGIDTLKAEIKTRSGKTMPVTLKETGNHTGIFTDIVKTTPAGQPQDGALEVAVNDTITATYVDPNPAQGTADPVHFSSVNIHAVDGSLAVGLMVPDPLSDNKEVFLKVYRVSGDNSPLTIKVDDRDMDTTDAADTITVKMSVPGGDSQDVKLTETGTHTGSFIGVVKLTTDAAATTTPTVFKAKAGDYITLSYVDAENSTGAPMTRDYKLRANVAEDAKFSFSREIVTYPVPVKGARQVMQELPTTTWEPTTVLTPGSTYKIRLDDGDLVPTTAGPMKTTVSIKSANGSVVEVPLESNTDPTTQQTYFEGEFFPRLGDANSPSRAYFSQTGSVVDIDPDKAATLWYLPAVNVQGKDKVTVMYNEPLAADGRKNVMREIPMRVAADAEITTLNLQGNPLLTLKPGLTFELQINDANGDLTPKRDTIKATLVSGSGDTLDLDLLETDVHSGIFSAMVKTAYGTAVAGDKILQANFDGAVKITYNDSETVAGTPAVRTLSLGSDPMQDASGVLLTKVYDDPKFELETLIRLGEARYAVGAAELSTNKGAAADTAPHTNADLQDAAHLLQEVVQRFPTSDYVVESLFLIGKIRQEEQKYDEAQDLFNKVINDYPDNELVPQALYQLVLLNYSRQDIGQDAKIDQASEAAKKLVYGYPKDPLVADAILRIAEFYYTVKKDYDTAAYIYKRLLERFPDTPKADVIAYRMATAYYRSGTASIIGVTDKDPMDQQNSLHLALRYYLQFTQDHPDSELADDALYWAADTDMKLNNVPQAYAILMKLLSDYKTGDRAPAARTLLDKIKQANPTIAAADF